MKNIRLNSAPTCPCGGRKFRPAESGKHRNGRRFFAVACLRCGEKLEVSKSTFTLFGYLESRQPSQAFLELYNLEP